MVTDINILRDGKVRKMLQEEIVNTCNIVLQNIVNLAEDSTYVIDASCLTAISEAEDEKDARASVSSLLAGITLTSVGLTLAYIGHRGTSANEQLEKDRTEGRITTEEHFNILVGVIRDALGFKSGTEEGIVK